MGFMLLFNGMDFEGWYGMGYFNFYELVKMDDVVCVVKCVVDMEDVVKYWIVDNGEFVNDGVGVYLMMDKFYENFEFWIDYKMVVKVDSGIYLKVMF